jgi:hypothetical protein
MSEQTKIRWWVLGFLLQQQLGVPAAGSDGGHRGEVNRCLILVKRM